MPWAGCRSPSSSPQQRWAGRRHALRETEGERAREGISHTVVSTASTVGAATWTAVLLPSQVPHATAQRLRFPPFALACFVG